MSTSPFSPVPDCHLQENIENQFIAPKPVKKKALPTPLLPLSSAVNDAHLSILKVSNKDNIFQSPPSCRNLKVTFQTPLRTPRAVKSCSPSAWSALRDLDDQERWVERTSIVTRQDHEDYVLLAKEFLDEIIENLPACQQPNPEKQPSEILVPTPAPGTSDLLFDFKDTITADKKTPENQPQQVDTVPVKDPFSPQREEGLKQEVPEVIDGGVLAQQEPVAPSVDLAPPVKDQIKKESGADQKELIEPEVPVKEPVPVEPVLDLPQKESETGVSAEGVQSEPAAPTMGDVSENIYDVNEDEVNPFGSSNKMQNSPPLPRAKSSGYNINFDEIDETSNPFGTTKQLANSPPKGDPIVPSKEVANSPPKADNGPAPSEVLANSPPKGDQIAPKQLVNSPPKSDNPSAPSKEVENSSPKVDPFASSKQLANSPPKKDPFATSKQLANSPPKEDPFASSKQLANSPPKEDPFASSKQLANSPPKEDPFASSKQLANSPPKSDPFAPSKQLGNSPPKEDPFAPSKQLANSPQVQNKKSPNKRKASPKHETDASSPGSATTTPNGDMKTTPSTDGEADHVPPLADPAQIALGIESENTSEDYVDALQEQEPTAIDIEKQTLPEGLGTDEFDAGAEEFRSADEVITGEDPAAFDMSFLEKAGSNSNFKESALARQSLYVKFDPLVGSAVAAGSPSNGMPAPANPQHTAIAEHNDLLQMQTPPTKGKGHPSGKLKHPAAVAAAKKAIAQHQDSPAGIDKILAFSPPKGDESNASDDSDARLTITPSSGNSQEDIVQILRYSQADLQNAVKAAREHEKEAAVAQKLQFEEDKIELKKQMDDKDQTIDNMKSSNEELRGLVTEYEKALQDMMGDMNKVKNSQDSRVVEIQKEKDQALEDMASVEGAFSDLHRRYEKLKGVVESYKKNEAVLKDCVENYKTKLTKQEQKYHTLKQHAEEKIEKANSEIDKVNKSYEAEVTGLSAAVKREQMKVSSLEQQIEQKTKDNAELTKICDELIARMGSGRS